MPLCIVVTRDVEMRYRGFLGSVMLEIAPGFYVGPRISKGVRDRIWSVMEDWHGQLQQGSITMAWRETGAPGGLKVHSLQILRTASHGQTRLKALVTALLLTASVGALETAATRSAHAQTATQTVNFSVPAGPLNRALTVFGRQSGLQVTYLASLASGKTSPGFSGNASRVQALAQILRGSGLSYSFPNATTVAIADANAGGNNSTATVEGAIALDTIDVAGGGTSADLPYRTPGSVNYISSQQIERFPGKTAGDIFKGTPGVISGMNRNGAAVDVNIRGLQGMGRVAVTVDGAQQSTSIYRGYNGVDNRSYIDPDLISGATITKGPDGGAAGAIGGTVAMDTLKASDILKPGDRYGVRIRGELSNNSIAPEINSTTWRTDGDDPTFGAKSGSIALASRGENVDLVAAYVRRKSGNYFAGTKGPLTSTDVSGLQEPLSAFKYGDEVFNTSQNVTSYLLKGTLRLPADQKLQLGYLRYENTFGEVMPTLVVSTGAPRQVPLSGIAIDQLTANYSWKPAGNDLIDLKANAWMSSTDEDSLSSVYIYDYYRYTRTKSYGVEVSNSSRFALASLPVTLRYGGKATLEDASQKMRRLEGTGTVVINPPNGSREIGELFVDSKVEPFKWLTLDAGINYLAYRTHNRGLTSYSTYDSQGYPPYEDYTGNGFSPSAGITVTPVDGWQFFARYTTGIRPPSLREGTYTNSALVFNPELRAEKARNWEFGTNLLMPDLITHGDVARLKLAYFDNTTQDYIGRKAESGSVLSLFNYDKIVMKGIELSGGYDSKPGFLDFALNYYTDFQACSISTGCANHTSQADYLTNHIPPEFSASITGALRFLDGDLTVGGRYTYMSKRLAPLTVDPSYFSFITVQWAPYHVVDAFGQWKVNDSVSFDVSLENLLDRYYVDALNNTDLPAPGRTFRMRLTAKTGGREPLPDLWPKFDFGGGLPDDDGSASVARWTGLYAGAYLGHGYGRITGETTAGDGTRGGIAAGESADQSLQNVLFGGQIGFNYQTPSNWVFGIEGDYGRTRLHDSYENISTEYASLTERKQLQARIDYQFDWLATLRGRVGYAFDNWLIYATGGVAFKKETEHRTQYRSNSNFVNPAGDRTEYFFDESTSGVRTGWTVGGGVEYALGSNWSLKGEYLYTGFGKEDFRFPNARAGATTGYYDYNTICFTCPGFFPYVPGSADTVNGRRASNDASLHSLKIGLNYRF
ncbi:MAG: type I-E CRISPR-associated endoribonuclease Cas2e [Hyphomicrobiaceae bacterium]